MEKTVLQTFTELNNLVSVAEMNLAEARKLVDAVAAQFGFVSKTPMLPDAGPYYGSKSDRYPGITDPAEFQQ